MAGSGFALELAVGMKDMFTQQARKVEAEVNRLDKDAKDMQKTFEDVSAYKKATKALEDLMQGGKASKDEIKQQEKAVDDLSKTLKRAGLDINNLVKDEERLSRQIKDTNSELKKRSGMKDLITGGLTTVASSGMLKAFLSSANNVERLAIDMRNATNYTPEQINSQSERDFRLRMQKDYAASMGQTMGVQSLLNQNNDLTGAKNQQATEAVIKLKSLMPKWDEEEIIAAMSPMMKNGTSAKQAAAMLYSIGRRGDVKGDLLDTVQEYMPNMAMEGMTTEQFMASLSAGKKAGAFNFDKVGDAIKESIRARLTDATSFASLMGKGKNAGTIEEITDPKLRKQFASAVFGFRDDVANNRNSMQSLGSIYQLIGEVRRKSPKAARDISEAVGGTILAEDIGSAGAAPIGKALVNPASELGDYQNEFDNRSTDNMLTTAEKAQAGVATTFQVASNAAADLTKKFDGLATTIQNAGGGLAGLMNEHSTMSMLGAGALSGVLLGGHAGGTLKLLKGLRGVLGAGGESSGGLFRGLLGSSRVAGDASAAGSSLKFGKGLLSGKGNVALTVGIGGLEAYNDYQKGDMRGVTGDVGGIGGSLAGGSLGAAGGAALGTMIFPGIGTAVGGAVGGIGGSILGEAGVRSLTESLYDWWNDDDDKSAKGDGQTTSPDDLLRSKIDLLSSTMSGAGIPGALPPIELNFSPQFSIQAMSANPDDISKALEDALRQSNPELIQQLQYALQQVMANNDNQRPS